jgi:hypothetical protein
MNKKRPEQCPGRIIRRKAWFLAAEIFSLVQTRDGRASALMSTPRRSQATAGGGHVLGRRRYPGSRPRQKRPGGLARAAHAPEPALEGPPRQNPGTHRAGTITFLRHTGRVFTDDVIDYRIAFLTKNQCPPSQAPHRHPEGVPVHRHAAFEKLRNVKLVQPRITEKLTLAFAELRGNCPFYFRDSSY